MPATVMMQELPWPAYRELIRGGAPVLLPVGATEQHGPHLPLGTDAMLVGELCRRAAGVAGAVVAPTLAYGAKSQCRSGGGNHFVGTTSLDGTTLIGAVRDIVCELARHGCRKLAVVSGHMENEAFLLEAVDLALRECRSRGHDGVRIVYPRFRTSATTIDLMFPEGFPGEALEHAARMETSMMLHLFPDRVRLDLIPNEPRGEFPLHSIFPGEEAHVPPAGVLSPAKGASAAFGRILVDESVEQIAAALRGGFA